MHRTPKAYVLEHKRKFQLFPTPNTWHPWRYNPLYKTVKGQLFNGSPYLQSYTTVQLNLPCFILDPGEVTRLEQQATWEQLAENIRSRSSGQTMGQQQVIHSQILLLCDTQWHLVSVQYVSMIFKVC